jgi:putative SOS response-associated peptidase YedK
MEDGVNQPWLITNAQQAFAAAALWDVWDGDGSQLLSCTLVTTAAADAFLPWHKRMPVLLDANEARRWLDNEHELPAGDPLFRSELKTAWRLQRLSRSVGNASNKNPAFMLGLGEPVELVAQA